MRKILFLIIVVAIAIKVPSEQERCNVDTAFQALPPRIFFESKIDGPQQNVKVTRFFHNKAGVLLSELGRCYFNAIEPTYLLNSTTVFGLLCWIWALYYLVERKRFFVILLITAVPLLAFFKLNFPIIPIANKALAAFGALTLMYKNEKS